MDKLLQGLALANDVTYNMEYIRGYLPVHNHEEAYETVKQAANDLHLRFNKSELMMIGEDFSLSKSPTWRIFLNWMWLLIRVLPITIHFDIDEAAFKYAASNS